VDVVKVPGELLHEVDGEDGKDSEENNAHRVVKIVDAVYMLLHQDSCTLKLFMLFLVHLMVHVPLCLEFLQLNVVDPLEKEVSHQVRHWH
jgi:hypothetical protein